MALNDPLVHELSMEDYMAAAVGLHGRTPAYYGSLAQAARNWLADREGWGPGPRVSRRELLGDIVGLSGWGEDEIVDRLRECGIEVTDAD